MIKEGEFYISPRMLSEYDASQSPLSLQDYMSERDFQVSHGNLSLEETEDPVSHRHVDLDRPAPSATVITKQSRTKVAGKRPMMLEMGSLINVVGNQTT